MKRLIVAVSATLFAVAAGAASDYDIYHGFAEGNSDLSTGDRLGSMSAVRPGVGDHYQGIGRANPDLFESSYKSVPRSSGHPDIYNGFDEGNSDLN